MAYDYTWIGGENNQASNPNCWSPTGLPQAGSTLDMTGGTMNVNGYTLPSGAFLDVLGQGQINVSNRSNFVVAVKYGLPTTINVSGTDTLVVGSDFDATAIVNLA